MNIVANMFNFKERDLFEVDSRRNVSPLRSNSDPFISVQ